MANFNLGSGPPKRDQRFWLMLLTRPVAGILLGFLIALGWSGWRLWTFIHQELAPLIEKNLSQTLNRPVELGAIQRFSPIGLRFGPSSIPAFTKQVGNRQVKDPDRVIAAGVDVVFNPIDLLLERTLKLDVTLDRPELYLEQAADGRWLDTTIAAKEKEGWIETKLQAIRFRQATAVVVPKDGSRRAFKNVKGNAIFVGQSQQIKFDIAAQAVTGGQVQVQGQRHPTSGVVVMAQAQNLPAQVLKGLIALPFKLQAGLIDGNIKADFRPRQQPSIEGTTQIRAAAVVVPEQYLLRRPGTSYRTFRQVNGTVELFDRSRRIAFNLNGSAIAGGNVNVQGEWLRPSQQINLLVRAQNLPAKLLDRLFKLPIAVSAGEVDGALKIQLRSNQLVNLQGSARLQAVTSRIANLPLPFTGMTGQISFQGLTTKLENVRALYGRIPLQASGSVDPKRGYNLSGQSSQVAVGQVLDTFQLQLPFSTAGQVQGQAFRLTGALAQPLLTGQVTTTSTARIDRVNFSQITGKVQLRGPSLTISQIRGVPVAGGVVDGDASFNLQTRERFVLNLQAREVPGEAIARAYGVSPAIQVGMVSAQAQIAGPPSNLTTAVQFQAPAATYPGTGTLVVSNGSTRLQNINLRVASGNVKLNGQVTNGQLQATVQGAGIQLQRFSPDLRGLFSGRLNLSVPVANFNPAALRAQGQVRFSQGLSLVQQPLTAQVRWDGQKILVDQAVATGFSANGAVFARFPRSQAPQISGFNLDVQAQDYPLTALPVGSTRGIKLAGVADVQGRLTGTPVVPNFQGTLQTQNLVVNALAFEPALAGSLSYGGRGLTLQVTGMQDRISLVLDQDFRPNGFYVQREQAIAQGRRLGEGLEIALQRFPLTAFNLNPRPGLGPVRGLASGNFNLNLRTSALQGELAIARPQLGSFTAEQFAGSVRFANGIATLNNGELQAGTSRYGVSATYVPGSDPQFRAQVKVAQAEIQDILKGLQWFKLEDIRRGLQPPTYAKAATVQPLAVGAPGAPLEMQLRRLSEIEVLLAQQVAQRQDASRLPDLAELEGKFEGTIDLAGSQRSGIATNFNLQGKAFEWGPYSINQITAKGRFANRVLNLQPLRLQSGQSLLTFTGQLGGPQQLGQLQVANVPVDAVRDLADLPIDVAGDLNATATISGSSTNPQVQGAVNLTEATLNKTPVQTAQANFRYANARLNFDSTVVASEPEPLEITGSIPYQLPFASVPPASQQISLNVNVQNAGISLLNLLTRQVAWVDGEGRVNLQVRGTLDRPLVNGTATVANATIQAQTLPGPLTGVTGAARFNRDRILVERLTGQFSQGQVAAAGVIPIFAEASPEETPLRVNLENLALRLKGLYTGGVNGNAIITGSVLKPKIGGTIQLSQGQVLLGESSASTNLTPSQATSNSALTASPLEFNNLQVTLGDRVQVTRPLLLNFLASGDLTVNGPINNLRPQGTIQFQRGQVNLFTTRFRVDPREPNYAQFRPSQGLDPDLNVNLVTTITEVTRSRINSLTGSEAEVSASALGSLESVRIRAKVNGRASQLASNFENVVDLSSSPARNQNEIIALIGGGIGDRLGEEESTLALANLAGSAFFSNIQGLFDNVLNQRVDFRLFPTLTPQRSGNSTLNLGAEVEYDVTDKLSASVLQVLTDPDEPTQLSTRYQLSDKINLRSSINLEGDTRALVEYRTRF